MNFVTSEYGNQPSKNKQKKKGKKSQFWVWFRILRKPSLAIVPSLVNQVPVFLFYSLQNEKTIYFIPPRPFLSPHYASPLPAAPKRLWRYFHLLDAQPWPAPVSVQVLCTLNPPIAFVPMLRCPIYIRPLSGRNYTHLPPKIYPMIPAQLPFS